MAPKAEPLLNQRRDSLRTASLAARTAAFELADRLLRFGDHYRRIAQPFDWTFTPTWRRAHQDQRARATACLGGVTDRSRAALWRLKGAARGR
jgi:hypothetical protein